MMPSNAAYDLDEVIVYRGDREDCRSYPECLMEAAKKNLKKVCCLCTSTCYEPVTIEMKLWLIGAGRCHSSAPESLPEEPPKTVKKGDGEYVGEQWGPLRCIEEVEPTGFNRNWTMECSQCGHHQNRSRCSIKAWKRGLARATCKNCGAK